MKIFDCFMYFDEEVVLDVRLNTLDRFVDYFIIVESKFTHKGDPRDLKFNQKKFEKFKDKIIYLIYEEEPREIEIVNSHDDEGEKSRKYIFNAAQRENGQRNYIQKGLVGATIRSNNIKKCCKMGPPTAIPPPSPRPPTRCWDGPSILHSGHWSATLVMSTPTSTYWAMGRRSR